MWLTFSILAAVGFGIRGIGYHWTSTKGVDRNLLLCGTFVMGAAVNLLLALLTSSGWSTACLVGIQMGLFSFAANASVMKGFAVGKASLVAVLTALPSVFVVLFAYLLWDERLHAMQLVAFLVIVGGVLLVRYSNDISLGNLQGAQWGLLAMLMYAGNDLTGKWSTMLEAETFPTLVTMFVTGALCFGAWWLVDRRKGRRGGSAASDGAAAAGQPPGQPPVRTHAAADASQDAAGEPAAAAAALAAKPRTAAWGEGRTFAAGMVIGVANTAGMLFILSAFGLGKAGLVSAVVALNVPLILLYARFVVKEKFARNETYGILLSFVGILLMRLFGGE